MGEINSDINKLEGEAELTIYGTKLENEKQKLQDAHQEWLINKVALKLLDEVTAKYGKEKQPAVIKNSSRYFTKFTDNSCQRMQVSLTEADLSIFDSKESIKKIDQLSRGTREQLLISLRLGFIEEYERTAEPLPIIMDDVFVNFDPVRTRKAAEIIQEFSANRQVLILPVTPIWLSILILTRVS